MADLATGERVAVAAVDGAQVNPAVGGDFIVWQDDRNGNWDIYAYDLERKAEFPVCRQVAGQTLPAITDSSVVWIDNRGDYTEIRGLKFGGIRRVAQVSRFDALSQDGAIRIMLGVREYADQVSYRLYRYPDGRPVPDGDRSHLQADFDLNGDTTYVYADTLIAEARNYFYTLGIVDGYGLETFVGPVAGNGYRRTPTSLVVGAPYPNPVRREVRLSFGLPRENAYSDGASWPLPADEKRGVDVSVYNVEGRVIRRLFSEVIAPGYYQVTWDGDNGAGVQASSGIYFLAVSVEGTMTSRKVILVR
jgi:beta propeller repeat protein